MKNQINLYNSINHSKITYFCEGLVSHEYNKGAKLQSALSLADNSEDIINIIKYAWKNKLQADIKPFFTKEHKRQLSTNNYEYANSQKKVIDWLLKGEKYNLSSTDRVTRLKNETEGKLTCLAIANEISNQSSIERLLNEVMWLLPKTLLQADREHQQLNILKLQFQELISTLTAGSEDVCKYLDKNSKVFLGDVNLTCDFVNLQSAFGNINASHKLYLDGIKKVERSNGDPSNLINNYAAFLYNIGMEENSISYLEQAVVVIGTTKSYSMLSQLYIKFRKDIEGIKQIIEDSAIPANDKVVLTEYLNFKKHLTFNKSKIAEIENENYVDESIRFAFVVLEIVSIKGILGNKKQLTDAIVNFTETYHQEEKIQIITALSQEFNRSDIAIDYINTHNIEFSVKEYFDAKMYVKLYSENRDISNKIAGFSFYNHEKANLFYQASFFAAASSKLDLAQIYCAHAIEFAAEGFQQEFYRLFAQKVQETREHLESSVQNPILEDLINDVAITEVEANTSIDQVDVTHQENEIENIHLIEEVPLEAELDNRDVVEYKDEYDMILSMGPSKFHRYCQKLKQEALSCDSVEKDIYKGWCHNSEKIEYISATFLYQKNGKLLYGVIDPGYEFERQDLWQSTLEKGFATRSEGVNGVKGIGHHIGCKIKINHGDRMVHSTKPIKNEFGDYLAIFDTIKNHDEADSYVQNIMGGQQWFDG